MKISRQAFYKNRAHEAAEQLQEEIVLELVRDIRENLPRVGGRKLYHMIKEDLQQLQFKIGRDKLFEILGKYGLLIEPIKQYVVTTNSHHRFRIYSNLVKNLKIQEPNKVFVADITYVRFKKGFFYLFLVTDIYSRKIVGYHLSMSLATDGAILAIKMAIRNAKQTDGLIHHSDRGFQYCSDSYVSLLQEHGISLSMGETGNPYDNAIAERVNGILKIEFFLNATFPDFETALKAVKQAIKNYNGLRPHMSIGYLTPNQKYAA